MASALLMGSWTSIIQNKLQIISSATVFSPILFLPWPKLLSSKCLNIFNSSSTDF
jgi:hypothetical protein